MSSIGVFVAWPYANGDLHLGHIAGAYLPADIFARFHRLAGNEVLMVSGSDAHGTPITLKAKQQGIHPKDLVDQYHQRMVEDFQSMGISFNLFTLTSTKCHKDQVSEFFLKLLEQGDLSKEFQMQFYDEQENMFLPDRYVQGTCPHCGYLRARGDECEQCSKTYNVTDIKSPTSSLSGSTPVLRETEHFFFHLEKYQDSLRTYVEGNSHWRTHVQNFTKSWVEEGLRPRAITRDIDWGVPVPVPGYEDKVIYVWFEAVIGYLSASKELSKLKKQESLWENWWKNPESKSFYFIGKDNVPFHTVIWPIELMAVNEGLSLPYDVPANHFLNIEGEKFSTSRGLAVWVRDLLVEYPRDVLRYYVTCILPETKDSNFSKEELKLRNNGELAAAWGNLVNRVVNFAVSKFSGEIPPRGELESVDRDMLSRRDEMFVVVKGLYEEVKLRDALKETMALAREVNKYLDETAPWSAIKKNPERAATVINVALSMIATINRLLAPVLVDSSERIEALLVSELAFFKPSEQIISGDGSDSHMVLFQEIEADTSMRLSPVDVQVGRKIEKLGVLFPQIERE